MKYPIYYAPLVFTPENGGWQVSEAIESASTQADAVFVEPMDYSEDAVRDAIREQTKNHPHLSEQMATERVAFPISPDALPPRLINTLRAAEIFHAENSEYAWPLAETLRLLAQDGPENALNSAPSMEEIQRHKTVLASAWASLPHMWNNALKVTGTRVILYPQAREWIGAIADCGYGGTIRVDTELSGKNKAIVRRVMLEEAVHAADHYCHFSECRDFVNACKALKEKPEAWNAMAQAVVDLAITPYENRERLQWGPALQEYLGNPAEMLAHYFAAKDRLMELNARPGCPLGYVIRYRQKPEKIEAYVDQQLEGIFGKEIAGECRDFEDQVRKWIGFLERNPAPGQTLA